MMCDTMQKPLCICLRPFKAKDEMQDQCRLDGKKYERKCKVKDEDECGQAYTSALDRFKIIEI